MNGAGVPPWVSPDTRLLLEEFAHLEGRLIAMADVADTALAELRTAITAAMDRISADVEELKRQITAGAGARAQEIADGIRAEAQRIRGIDPDPAFPPPPPPPAP